MANLQDLKIRIGSVKSTQKITKAMQMVAAAKLKKAQEKAGSAAPYAERMQNMLSSLAANIMAEEALPELLTGRKDVENQQELIVVISSDRGLCGGLNTNLLKLAEQKIREVEAKGGQAKLYIVGKKAKEVLSLYHKEKIIGYIEGLTKGQVSYREVQSIASEIVTRFDKKEFDSCTILYNKFASVIAQIPTTQQIIPLSIEQEESNAKSEENQQALYIFEPSQSKILEDLLPKNITVQLLHAILENAASEQGARMTAMDNATRNAGEMIKDLTLVYNRTRQAAITTELIEIISGAEALQQ